MWRQGDVLIERIDSFSKTSLNETKDRLLVRGEGKYHGHFILGEVEIFANEEFSTSDTVSHFIEVKKEATLKHLHLLTNEATGEHGDLNIAPGTYRVIRQREYNPYAKIIEIIKD